METMNSRPDRERGFLYVEILCAMAILAIALLALVPTFVVSAKENASAGDLTFATTAAQDKAEQLKRVPYAKLANGSDVLKLQAVPYQRSWVVVANTPHPDMSTVTVTVTPKRVGSFGGKREASVSFYRSR